MTALGDLFAPAYIGSNPQSVAAVNDWMAKNYSMTNPKVEQTRQPVSFNTGNPAGMVDPEALRVLAQGGPYDMDARRNAIAAQVTANQAAQPTANPAIGQPGSPTYSPYNDPTASYYTPAGYHDPTSGFIPYSSTNQMPLSYANGGNYPGS
jgi:hypothetical protein